MITPLNDSIKGVMEFTWPMIIICILTLSSIRITYLIKNKKEFVLYREIFYLLFLIYILCLFQVVTVEDTSSLGSNNLIPLKEIFRYKLGSRLFFKNVIGNIVLFIPYGLFVTAYTKIERPFHALCLVFFASTAIEVTQLLIGRVFDIDDIILNVLGGFIGYTIWSFADSIGERLPKIFKSTWFLNLFSIVLVILFISYAWMVVIK